LYELKSAGGTLQSDFGTAYVKTLAVDSSFLRVLGEKPARGRDFTEVDTRSGAAPAALLSYRLWHDSLGGDLGILDSTVKLDGQRLSVVGILPESFWFPGAIDLLLPLKLDPGVPHDTNVFSMIGCLKPERNIENAREEASSLFRELQKTSTSAREERGLVLASYKDHLVGDVRQELLLLFAAAAVVFLISCVNLSSVTSARANKLKLQDTLRIALGGNWRHILRNSLLENSLLALVGAIAAWILARLLIPFLIGLNPTVLPRADEVGLGFAEAGFAALAAFVALVIIGLVPTLRVAFPQQIASPLRSLSGGRTALAGRGARRAGQLLVIGQLALTVPVLCASLVLVGNLRQLQ
ncbi:MAG: ABC transporter permease, partial [Planctomycetota bacterium]